MTALTWSGGNGGWFNASNWTPAQVPQSGDTATITSGSAQLTSNPADGVTLNFDGTNPFGIPLFAQNVQFGPHFTIVATPASHSSLDIRFTSGGHRRASVSSREV
jgi:hypothetical protein